MAIRRKAVVRDGWTVNVVVVDDDKPYTPAAGETLVDEAVAPPWLVDPTAVARASMEGQIDQAGATLATIIALPDVDAVPAGTLTAAQLSNGLRTLRDHVQQNRVAVRQEATIVRRLARYVRGQFDAE